MSACRGVAREGLICSASPAAPGVELQGMVVLVWGMNRVRTLRENRP